MGMEMEMGMEKCCLIYIPSFPFLLSILAKVFFF